MVDRQAAPGNIGRLLPAVHRLDEIAVIEIDDEGHSGEILRREIERRLRQVDAVIMADRRARQHPPHQARITAGNVEDLKRPRKAVCQSRAETVAHRLVRQAIGIDELLIGGPLLLKLLQRRGIDHCAPVAKLMNADIDQASTPGDFHRHLPSRKGRGDRDHASLYCQLTGAVKDPRHICRRGTCRTHISRRRCRPSCRA